MVSTPKNADSIPSVQEGQSTLWFPPEVRKSFKVMLRAFHHLQHAKLAYLCKKYQKKFPAYSALYLEQLAYDRYIWGHTEEAVEIFQQALNAPDPVPSTAAGITKALLDMQRTKEAQEVLKEWIPRFPDDIDLLKQGCRMLTDTGRFKDALQLIQSINSAKPLSELYDKAGECFIKLGRFHECMEAYAEAERLSPTNYEAWLNHIFFSHYVPEYTHETLLSIIHDWYRICCKDVIPNSPEVLERQRDPQKKLRIGLFSYGFNMHPVGWMTSESLWYLSKLPDCELYFYASYRGLNDQDFYRDLCQAAATQWIDTSKMSLDACYVKALKDSLDIAIDLSGAGCGSVFPLFVKRLAPVQVKWIGCLFDTSGIPAIDYLISDRYETPDGSDDKYTECLVRMPYSYVSYRPVDAGDTERLPYLPKEESNFSEPNLPEPFSHPELGEWPIRFASFNNLLKVNEKIVAVWSRILHAVPDSTIFLKTQLLEYEEPRKYIRSLFVANGIDADRVELEGSSHYRKLLQNYRKVDIALDTWPYNGGLTTLEALWMGVPVVTTPGPSFAGRHALSHLYNLDLKNLVAKDLDEYVDIAVRLAHERKLLADLRVMLPYSLLTSPLTQHHQFAADFHTALRAMWDRYCQGLPPAPMRFEQLSEIPEEIKKAMKK